jgi:hypothetical protein
MSLIGQRNVRLLTALAVIGLCGWPVWQGFDVIRFAMAGTQPDAVRPWVAVSGLAFAAREDALTPTDDSSDDQTIRKRRDELAEILAIRPLSSISWLQLAEARVDAHDGIASAIEALQLSEVTGPNEDYMIMQRGMFGIWQWEALPSEVQTRAAADLAATPISDGKAAWLKTTLAGKSDQVRQEIRSALQVQGFSQNNFNRIGLQQ